MKMEMIDGPQGPQRCEDGGGHLITAGEAIVAGDLLVADYANASTIAGGTTPGAAGYAEHVFMVVDLAGIAECLPNSLYCVAKDSGAAGEKIRASFTGYVKTEAVAAILTSTREVGIDVSTGKFGPVGSGDIVLGRGLGVAISAGGLGQVWFDGTSGYEKA